MTTASRVSDSRVTDEMVDAALSTWYLVLTKDKRADMRSALEAAMACQGVVVTVSDLEELRDEIRYQASLKDHYAEWEETERMFAALIAKAENV